MKKALSLILVFVMLIAAFPISSYALENPAISMTPQITDAVYEYLDEVYIEKYPELGLEFSFGSEADKQVLQTLSDTLTQNCETDKQKADAVVGWADRNVQYKSYVSGTYYFPIDVFYYRTGNCLGLGLFISQVLRLAGVPAVFCAGTRGDMRDYISLDSREVDHGWVMIYYNGTWNLYDPLFDVFGTTDREFISRWYFTDFIEGVSPYYEGMNCNYVYYGDSIYYIDGRFVHYKGGMPASEYWGNAAEGGSSLNGCVPYFAKNRYFADGGGTDGFTYVTDPERRDSMINDECYSGGWIQYGEWLWGYARANGIIAGCTIKELDGQTLYLPFGSSPVRLDGKPTDYSLVEGTVTAGIGETFTIPMPLAAESEIENGRVIVYESIFPEIATVSADGTVTTLSEGYAVFQINSKDSYDSDVWYLGTFVEIYVTDEERVYDYSDNIFSTDSQTESSFKALTEGSIVAKRDVSVEDFLTDVKGAVVKDVNGEEVTDNKKLGSGMTVTLPDGTDYTVVVKGDTDSDGSVTSSDARLVLRASVGLENDKPQWFSDAGNVSLDEGSTPISADDARMILRGSVGLEDTDDWFNSAE